MDQSLGVVGPFTPLSHPADAPGGPAVLGIACIPELEARARLGARARVPVVGLPLESLIDHARHPDFAIPVQPMWAPVRKEGAPVEPPAPAEAREMRGVQLTEAPWLVKRRGGQ